MRKSRSVEYVVYPPNYDPWGDKPYRTVKTKLKAACLAQGMGAGTEVHKCERRTSRYTDEDGARHRSTLYHTVKVFIPKSKGQ